MSPIRVPEGFVKVDKEPGIAAKLLDAADSVEGADRKTDVRTVTGAYHVTKEVFEKYQELFGSDEQADDEDGEQVEPGNTTEAAASVERTGNDPLVQNPQGDGSEEQGNQPDESWTHDQLNAYAADLTPPLELTGSTPAKAEKVKLIAEHIEKNKA